MCPFHDIDSWKTWWKHSQCRQSSCIIQRQASAADPKSQSLVVALSVGSLPHKTALQTLKCLWFECFHITILNLDFCIQSEIQHPVYLHLHHRCGDRRHLANYFGIDSWRVTSLPTSKRSNKSLLHMDLFKGKPHQFYTSKCGKSSIKYFGVPDTCNLIPWLKCIVGNSGARF